MAVPFKRDVAAGPGAAKGQERTGHSILPSPTSLAQLGRFFGHFIGSSAIHRGTFTMYRQHRKRRVRTVRTRVFLETLESRLAPSIVDGATEWPVYPGQWIAQFRDVTGTPAEQIAVIDGEVESLGAGLQVQGQLGADGLVMVVG